MVTVGTRITLQIASRLCYKAAMSTGGAPIIASARYELQKTASSWTVWDTAKGTPALVKGVWQVDLELELADELTDALNWLADQAPASGDVT